jgi:nitroreductase
MSTLRAVRLFTEQPIDDDDLTYILEMATKASNGSNRQTWRFLVIRDPKTRHEVGSLYLESLLQENQATTVEDALARPNLPLRTKEVLTLGRDMGKAPALVLCCDLGGGISEPGASLFPAVQNLMLAAWSRGIGSVLTTIWMHREEGLRKLLGIPKDVYIGCLIPLGHPARSYGPPRRAPLGDVIFNNAWGH